MKLSIAWLACLGFALNGWGYDPLEINEETEVGVIDLSFTDLDRDREIPLRVYLPERREALPVIMFSHGLGGSREGSEYLGSHWAHRGYVAVMMQHPGSDSSVWKEAKVKDRMKAMQEAASAKNFRLRVEDVPAVINQLEKWNRQAGHALEGAMDLERIGMSGHSFGAKTTQAVSGEVFIGKARFTDPRIDAACAFSPSPPRRAKSPEDAQKSFSGVGIPWMLMTGTEDESAIGNTSPEQRTWVFPALPPGDKYQLVLDGAEHMAFSDRRLRGQEHRNPNHHRVIKALSTAFWDAHVSGNQEAADWLKGSGPRELMEPGDQWDLK
jgi:predicted dienelactone hydrolase